MKTIKDLKQMISEPASKEWFAKHGVPKSVKNHPGKAAQRALDKSTYPKWYKFDKTRIAEGAKKVAAFEEKGKSYRQEMYGKKK